MRAPSVGLCIRCGIELRGCAGVIEPGCDGGLIGARCLAAFRILPRTLARSVGGHFADLPKRGQPGEIAQKLVQLASWERKLQLCPHASAWRLR